MIYRKTTAIIYIVIRLYKIQWSAKEKWCVYTAHLLLRVVLKPSLGGACSLGDVCRDVNAECDVTSGRCRCRAGYQQVNNMCSTWSIISHYVTSCHLIEFTNRPKYKKSQVLTCSHIDSSVNIDLFIKICEFTTSCKPAKLLFDNEVHTA